MVTAFRRTKGKIYKEDRWKGRMSLKRNGRSGLLEERLANLRKGRHERLYRKAGFMMLCGQLQGSAKGDISYRLESNRALSGRNEKGNGGNSLTNIKAKNESHTCTQVPRLHGTTRLNKGFEKASWRVKKKCRQSVRSTCTTASYITNLFMFYCTALYNGLIS